ncbi:MAG: iron-sulfur cluster assembly protein [Anaerolineales bacterium]
MALDMTLREQILMRLVDVIDPETGVDVLRMRLVEDLSADEESGVVTYCFRPSSPLCPLAHSLAVDIKHAIAKVPGVTEQKITVAGYVKAEELTEIINREDV